MPNKDDFIEPAPWTNELEEVSKQQLVDWVGKNCNGNPTISKESIIDSIQVDVDLPNTHPTMEAIFDLPDGKKFKGYPAVVEFFEGLGYKGFPGHNMPDYLNPDIPAEDITNEERADHNEYLKEIQGAETDLDDNLDKELASSENGNSSEPTATANDEPSIPRAETEENDGPNVEEVLNSEEPSSEPSSEAANDEFSADDLAKYRDMADRAANGEDVGVDVGADAPADNDPSSIEGDKPNNDSVSKKDSDFAVDIAEEASNIEKETDKAVNGDAGNADANSGDIPKDTESKPKPQQSPQQQSPQQQHPQQHPQQKAMPHGININFGLADLVNSIVRPFAKGGAWAYNKAVEGNKNAKQHKIEAGDPKLDLFADAKVDQVNRTKDGIMDNMRLMSAGLNPAGHPASDAEKDSMRNVLSTQLQDYGNRLQEATEQLGNPDVGIKQKKSLMDSIKGSNDVLKAIDSDDSEEANKLKDQTKNLLKAISELLKGLFGRGKDKETTPGM